MHTHIHITYTYPPFDGRRRKFGRISCNMLLHGYRATYESHRVTACRVTACTSNAAPVKQDKSVKQDTR